MSGNNVDSIDDTEEMDVEKLSVPEEDQLSRSRFAGPLNWFACIHFIRLCQRNRTADENLGIHIGDMLEILSTSSFDFNNEFVQLHELAKEYFLDLYICVIEQNQKNFYTFPDTSKATNENICRAFLIYDKANRSCYPFYKYDDHNKRIATFPINDEYTEQLFQNSVNKHDWFGHFETIQHSPNDHIENNEYQPTKTSEDITEDTAIIRDRLLKNDQQKILANIQITTDQAPLPLNPQLIISTDIELPKLKLLNQATRFRHNRETKTVGNGCPAIQIEGAPQRTPLLLQLPKEIRNYNNRQFYIGTHPTTYDGNEHAQKRIQSGENRSIISDHHVDIFFKITEDDLKNLQKKIKLFMFNLKQDGMITKDLIRDQKLIWCRLMFAIYLKSSQGQFQRVSPAIFSDLIQDTHSSQTLAFETIFPEKFCERGGQMIFIKLEESVTKDGLRVSCNGRILDRNDYQIATIRDQKNNMTLSFETPKCLLNSKDLHIVIDKQDISNWLVVTRPFHSHDNHPEPCGVMKED